MEADILPPSDDRVFKLILTSPEAKPVLIDLVSSIIKRPVVDVVVRNNEDFFMISCSLLNST